MCVASGNARSIENLGYNDMFTILTPGIAKQAITVGAIDNNYVLYESSSAGPVAVNYNPNLDSFIFNSIDLTQSWLKPDVVGPGVLLNTTAFEDLKTKVVSGTSYSTAVVTGVCALLKEIFPENKPSTFKASFLETSTDISSKIETILGQGIDLTISSFYQGAGLINASKASFFLINPPSITVWPKKIPYTKEIYFLNEYDSFFLSIFVNKEIQSLSKIYDKIYWDSLKISLLPWKPSIGQYNVIIDFATADGVLGLNKFPIYFNDGFLNYKVDVSFYVRKGKGRILYDCNEIGTNTKFSMYGNLNSFLDISRNFGLIPIVLQKDMNSIHISDLDLRDYEALALLNYNSSQLQKFTDLDVDSILDFLLPGGEYLGGTILLLPTRASDISGLNFILNSFNISYNVLVNENETLDVSSIIHPLTRNYNTIDLLSLISPLEVMKENDNYNTIADRFVYNDTRQMGGSLILACNNLEMFLSSPYFYNSLSSKFEEKQASLYFNDNYKMLENIMFSSAMSNLLINYSISSTEVSINDEIKIKISAHNQYKPLIDWYFFLTLESKEILSQKIEIRYFDKIDFRNGTYVFYFKPKDY